MSFTVEYLEYILLVFVRVASICVVAPFFSQTQIPNNVKAGISFFLSLIVVHSMDYTPLAYVGSAGFVLLVVQEALTGIFIGMSAGFCQYILSFAGHMIDMEIGFSMVQELDPTTNVLSTITGNFYSYIFMLFFLISDMHYYILDALYDSYKLIPIGGAKFSGDLLDNYMIYMVDYFTIGFRIILPIFACILVINIVLGILARVAPQMNMFVIGMQLKIVVGLFLLYITLQLFAGVSDFLFEEMQKLIKMYIDSMKP